MADAGIDLFEDIPSLPIYVQAVINRYEPLLENEDPYKCCADMLAEMEPLGYTFDYGLSGEPFDLQPNRLIHAR